MIPNTHPSAEDLTLYAMQLLNGEDAAVITTHLESCATCRDEFSRLLSDLANYAATAELESPAASARQRLLQQVAREKKIVPIAKPAEAAPATLPIAAFGRSGSLFNIEEAQPKRSAGRAIFAGVGWAVAAALAVTAGFLYKDRIALRNTLAAKTGQTERLTAEAAASHQLLDALTDPKAVRVTLTTTPLPKAAPIGGVTYNPDKGTMVFLASNLDTLQDYKTYELWVIPADGSAPIPAGTFHPDDQGNASLIMPDLPKGIPAKAFGVTIEAEGGAPTPTPPIILSGN